MEINKNASKIDLSDSNLEFIPTEIFECKNLQKLILRNNRIRVIPKEIVRLRRLRMLDLSNNRIDVLYAKLFSLVNLETLSLNQNKIRLIPPQIGNLKELRKFSISGNTLKTFPVESIQLINLEFLNISFNPFDEFPEEILGLSQLKCLRISNINFKSFPTERIYKELTNLKSLYCYGTHINQIRTQETNRDYLFLATNQGNCIRRLKSLIDLPSLQNITLELEKQSLIHRITLSDEKHPIKSIKETTVHVDISDNKKIIFICYSHQDEKWRKEVETSIKSMQYEGIDVDPWSDKRIRTSTKWKDEIFETVSKAKIAVLLISKYFLASSFIQNQELPKIIDKAGNDELRIMNILISHCRFENNKKLSQYQSLNPPDAPLLSLTKDKRDYFLLKLTNEIEYYINK